MTIRPRPEFTEIYTESEIVVSLDKVRIDESGYRSAKKFASGWDMYHLESEWRMMLASRKSIPENPNGSFVGFVKKYIEKMVQRDKIQTHIQGFAHTIK